MSDKSLMQIIKNQWQLVLLALSFFTRVPVKVSAEVDSEMLNKASRYFALIGLFIGLVCALVYAISLEVFPKNIAIILAIAVGILLTGAFHEDGWADVWDGFGGGWTVEQKLNIMKDSRLGTYGAASLFLILALKFFSLLALASPIVALIVAHTLSRVVATSLIFDMPYVAEDATSKVKPLAQTLSNNSLKILLLTGAFVLFLSVEMTLAIVLIAILIVTRTVLKFWFTKQLGGYTGDCLGAAQQATEVVIYLSLIALSNQVSVDALIGSGW